MDCQEMREFYDLCQAYRTVPASDLTLIEFHYKNLLNWVNGYAALAADRQRDQQRERYKEFFRPNSLFLAIGHGDKEHQDWLLAEIKSWFAARHKLSEKDNEGEK